MKLSQISIKLTIKIAISQSGITPLLRSFLGLRRLLRSRWGDPPATASVVHRLAWYGVLAGCCGGLGVLSAPVDRVGVRVVALPWQMEGLKGKGCCTKNCSLGTVDDYVGPLRCRVGCQQFNSAWEI